MKKRIAILLIGTLICLTSCPCSAYIKTFTVIVQAPNQILSIDQPLVINQPTRVFISVPASYSSSGACRAAMINVQSVSFYNSDIKIGEITTPVSPDDIFKFEWLITPGKDGIPVNGSIQARVTAKANNGMESDPYPFTIQINAVTP